MAADKRRVYRQRRPWCPVAPGEDDFAFDYAGKNVVSPPEGLRGLAGRVPGYIGTPVGSTKLGSTMEALVGSLQERIGAGESVSAQAVSLWRQRMGDKRVRTHMCGMSLRQNRVSRELVVLVDAALWAHEFQMSAPSYLQEWNHLCDEAGIGMQADKLTFRVPARVRRTSSARALSERAATVAQPAPKPVPLTDEECARVARAVSVIGDQTLRQKAYDAMKSGWELEKSQQGEKGA